MKVPGPICVSRSFCSCVVAIRRYLRRGRRSGPSSGRRVELSGGGLGGLSAGNQDRMLLHCSLEAAVRAHATMKMAGRSGTARNGGHNVQTYQQLAAHLRERLGATLGAPAGR